MISNEIEVYLFALNPFQPSVAFHIETSHLICKANEMNGFCMKCNTGLKRNRLILEAKFGNDPLVEKKLSREIFPETNIFFSLHNCCS